MQGTCVTTSTIQTAVGPSAGSRGHDFGCKQSQLHPQSKH